MSAPTARASAVCRPSDLPALSTLSDLPTRADLRPSDAQSRAFATACERLARDEGTPASELHLGCVVRLDRGFPAVAWEGGLLRGEFAAQLTKASYSRVAVGDWVCLRVPAGHEMGLIQELLPRASDLSRWRGGNRGERQTLAANVDVVLVCQALQGAGLPSCDRLARAAVIGRDCGCDVAVVLTKADRAGTDGLRAAVRSVRAALGNSTSVTATCAGAMDGAGPVADGQLAALAEAAREVSVGWGADAVRTLVAPGTIAVVLGESGAGKSTLLNALLGHDALATGAVRVRDDRGRHTTVARRMVRLPGAGIVIDAPGLRSLPLVGHERGLSQVFPEVVAAARGCRFRDCTHTHEPGCTVRQALDEGRFSRERLGAYLALAAEMRESAATLDPDVLP